MKCIYILTNKSFPDLVKIGYSADISRRLKELNSETGVPYPFEIYATYEVDLELSDILVQRIIDSLNPELRTEDNDRVREFYKINPETALDVLYSIAKINGFANNIHIWTEDENKKISKRFSFKEINLEPGTHIKFNYKENEFNGEEAFIVDDHHIYWEDESWTVNTLAKYFTHSAVNGLKCFFYNDESLYDIFTKIN